MSDLLEAQMKGAGEDAVLEKEEKKKQQEEEMRRLQDE
jgi:hypothetical protein